MKARKTDGQRHRCASDPAKARWYAASRARRYARFVRSLADRPAHPEIAA